MIAHPTATPRTSQEAGAFGVMNYAEKKAARIERMRARAASLRSQADHIATKNDKILGVMNGTPILRGHHSEKRHRRELDRIHSDIRKSIDARQEADRLESAATSAEENRTISSDDPDALDLLRLKLADIERKQASAKQVNAAIRSARRSGDGWEPRAVESLSALGYSTSTAQALTRPDAMGDVGVPAYRLSLWSAEVRRVKSRIAELEARETTPAPKPIVVGDVRIVEEENRVRVFFPGKPDEATRSALRARGFLWAPSVGAWQRKATPDAWRAARAVVGS